MGDEIENIPKLLEADICESEQRAELSGSYWKYDGFCGKINLVMKAIFNEHSETIKFSKEKYYDDIRAKRTQ